jgi:phytoene synthase
LAWWRDALERLDTSGAPAEPRLQGIAAELLPREVSGAKLAEIEDGFAALLDEEPDLERLGRGGAALFACAATLLGADDPKLEVAGAAYALAQATRNGCIVPVKHRADALAGHRFARSLRPITGFARLAVRDLRQLPAFEPEATPGRAAALLSHRLFGTVA